MFPNTKKTRKSEVDQFKYSGWLKKKSPNILKGWQNRFFMITISGQHLVYYESEDVAVKPSGVIDLLQVISINSPEKCVIKIAIQDREFLLKAPDNDATLEWIKKLKIAADHTKSSPQKHSSIVGDRNSARMSGKSWKDIDPNLLSEIQQEKEKNQDSNSSSSDDEVQIKENDEELLNKIGVFSYIKSMHKDFIFNRMIYGKLGKRSKGKIKYFQQCWFFLISAKPLFKNYADEKILDESQIPPSIELEVLYCYKPSKKGLELQESMKLTECQELIIKNMSKSKESGYSFKINMGDKIYHLMSDKETERQRWCTAINLSTVTAKEIYNKVGIKLKKNINSIVEIYDKETGLLQKKEKLREQIDYDFFRLKDDLMGDDYYDDSFENLMKFLPPLTEDMLNTLNACIVKDPQRTDIVREYIDFLHEKICEIIRDFWDKVKLDTISLLKLAEWMNGYHEKLKKFIEDERIINGTKTLLSIYFNRTVENAENIVQQIIEYEKNCEPFQNENEQLVSQSPYDLFKIINEGYDLAYQMCPIQDTVMKSGIYAKSILNQYETGLEELMDEDILKAEKYIAICNNTIQLNNQVKQFQKRIQAQGQLTEESVQKVFDDQKIIKKFVSISNISKDKIFYYHFGNTQQHLKSFFLDIKLSEIVQKLIEPALQQIQLLHDSFQRKIWKQFLDVFVIYYFNAFVLSCPKAKKDHLDEFLEKLEVDKEAIMNEFEPLLFTNVLNNCLVSFDNMLEFMQNDSISILEPCRNLRIHFGRAFTEKTVKQLLSLRHDMNKERKKDTQEACKDLLDDYNKKNKDEVNDLDKMKFVEVLGKDEDEVEEEEEKKEDNGENRRMDINLDDFDTQDDSQLEERLLEQQRGNQEEIEKLENIEEGFLYKKKPKAKLGLNPMKMVVGVVNTMNQMIKDWDHRYFRMRKGYLYWYLNDRSREAQNKLDLKLVEDIIAHQSKTTVFKIMLEDGKKYRLKAENQKERDLWVKSLNKEIKSIENESILQIEAIKTGSGKKALIYDYDQEERQMRQKAKAEERRQKRQQREAEQKRKQSELKRQLSQQQREMGTKQESGNLETEQGVENGQRLSCMDQFLICLGLKRGN